MGGKITWKYTIKCIASAVLGTAVIAVPVTCNLAKRYYTGDPVIIEKKIYIKQKSGEKIYTQNWFFTDTMGGCDIVAEGKGESELKFPRPEKWKSQIYHHRLIVNFVGAFGNQDLKYGGELLYYYMVFPRVGFGGGVEVTANQALNWNAEIKAGIIADLK